MYKGGWHVCLAREEVHILCEEERSVSGHGRQNMFFMLSCQAKKQQKEGKYMIKTCFSHSLECIFVYTEHLT